MASDESQTTEEPVESDDWRWDDGSICAQCRGTGMVHPLSAPKGYFVASYTECPICEGTGRDV